MEIKTKVKKTISIQELAKKLNLENLVEKDTTNVIISPSIYRIGYELTGFFNESGEELNKYIHVLGKKEAVYLEGMSSEKRREFMEKYFSFDFPVLILTYDSFVNNEFIELAKKNGKPLLKSKLRTTELIRAMKFYLQRELAPETIINNHILLDIYGVGMLITGDEEAKLGATIELLERGHKFITDTKMIVKKISDDELVGINSSDKNSPDKHFFLFGKDGNSIDLTNHFGIKSTRKRKKINMLVVLEKWDEKKFYDRLGLDEVYEEILDYKIPKVTLPVRKGRNLAIIIETAAINHRLKKTGVNSAEYFWEESKKMIAENKKRSQRGQEMDNRKLLPVRKIKNQFNLEILNGEKFLDTRYITTTGIHRPSLALSGYFDMYEEEGYNGVQIFSNVEFKFLESLDEKEREKNLRKYFDFGFPMIILSGVEEIPDYFMDIIKEKEVILLRSPYERTSEIVAKYSGYLETYFAPNISIHGVFVEMYGFGVLLTGKSGIGKSETALELIHRGHRLIADDMVKFVRGISGDVVGKAAKLPYFMEIRGLGIIDIKALYGLGAVRISKRLDAIIELQEQKSENYLTSVNYMSSTTEILDNSIYKAVLYISSGRNAAAMVEIAVMNLMAKRLGYDSEKSYLKGKELLTRKERILLED
ncbi:MAG: HPr(Ser) kinase/phosphatase [Cetobacterium sp.]|uniref:HPr(Ser) kinase/phosphatase n=1 Tax=unclassified Cetobacterium TaxID=2630983 RepID=UPI00163D1346|nr:HPr(Ser) kinase/phosphatase [Cetobacterium sp. 2A]